MDKNPLPSPAPKGCTSFKVRQLARVLSRHYDAEIGKAGLKTTQYALLSHVLRLGPLSPGELAHEMGLDASTLTRNLQPLLANGWLVQEAGANARTRSIHITPAGRDKREEAIRHWKAAQLNINALLGDDRVALLHELLEECMTRLQAAEHHSPTKEQEIDA